MHFWLGDIRSDGIEECGWKFEAKSIGLTDFNEHDFELRKSCLQADLINLLM